MTRSRGTEAPSDLRGALRLRTAEAHRRLDSLPQQRALVRPGLTVAGYAAILAGHARAQARCEARMARVAAARPTDLAPYRLRLPALQADLARLPAAPARPEMAPEPARPLAACAVGTVAETAVPQDTLEAEGRYLGLRYVLDGATQGARWIAPRLAENLPELSAGRFAFWRLQQDEAQVWGEVTRVLSAQPAEGRLADAAIAAACEAFDAFLEAFAPAGRAASVDGVGAAPREGTP